MTESMELNKIFISKQQLRRATSLDFLVIDVKLNFMILEIANAEVKDLNKHIPNQVFKHEFLFAHYNRKFLGCRPLWVFFLKSLFIYS